MKEKIETALRSVGLYADADADMEEVPDSPVFLVKALIGDLAFTDRVQQPAQVAIDAAFSDLARSLQAAEYEDARSSLLKLRDEPLWSLP